MIPFDLRGPEFLVFYLVLGVATLGVVILVRRDLEPRGVGRLKLSDPYLIAYLRGGKNEVLRVATVGLVDRGLLKAENSQLQSAASLEVVSLPVEKALLEAFQSTGEAGSVFSNTELESTTVGLRQTLERHGLIPDDQKREVRRWIARSGALFLASVALIKIIVALARGHGNIGFLIILAAGFIFATYKLANPPRTPRGDAILKDLRTLFSELRNGAGRLRQGKATNEALLLAAVFGMAALPTSGWAYARSLYPRAAASGANCGSSCGSSSGSSCGSSCGGGCGGGCGGCGS